MKETKLRAIVDMEAAMVDKAKMTLGERLALLYHAFLREYRGDAVAANLAVAATIGGVSSVKPVPTADLN